MKVIDVDTKGNVVRLYLGADDCFDYYGDDWDNAPAELNAETVYNMYVEDVVEFAFPFDKILCLYCDDCDNSPYCKNDFKKRVAPYLIVVDIDEDEFYITYQKYAGAQSDNVLKIYYEDNIDELKKKILDFGGIQIR